MIGYLLHALVGLVGLTLLMGSGGMTDAFLAIIQVTEFISKIGFGILVIAGLLDAIGIFICLKAPQALGNRGFILAAATCKVGAFLSPLLLLFSIFFEYLLRLGISDTGIMLLVTLAIPTAFLLSQVAWILFLIFLGRVAQHIGRKDLTARAWSILVMGVVITVSVIISIPISFVHLVWGGIIMSVISVLTLILAIRSANLLDSFSEAIS